MGRLVDLPNELVDHILQHLNAISCEGHHQYVCSQWRNFFSRGFVPSYVSTSLFQTGQISSAFMYAFEEFVRLVRHHPRLRHRVFDNPDSVFQNMHEMLSQRVAEVCESCSSSLWLARQSHCAASKRDHENRSLSGSGYPVFVDMSHYGFGWPHFIQMANSWPKSIPLVLSVFPHTLTPTQITGITSRCPSLRALIMGFDDKQAPNQTVLRATSTHLHWISLYNDNQASGSSRGKLSSILGVKQCGMYITSFQFAQRDIVDHLLDHSNHINRWILCMACREQRLDYLHRYHEQVLRIRRQNKQSNNRPLYYDWECRLPGDKFKHATPLSLAVMSGNVRVVEYLLDCGVNVNDNNSPKKKYLTPLHYACSLRSLIMTKLLISRGADINAQTTLGTTPLHSFLMHCRLTHHNCVMLDYILSHGADINMARGNIVLVFGDNCSVRHSYQEYSPVSRFEEGLMMRPCERRDVKERFKELLQYHYWRMLFAIPPPPPFKPGLHNLINQQNQQSEILSCELGKLNQHESGTGVL